MVRCLEVQGHLGRPEGRPATPGLYNLVFRLYATLEDQDPLWEEEIFQVAVEQNGQYHTILGQTQALEARFFEEAPVYLGVCLGQSPDVEAAPRMPLLGSPIRLSNEVRKLEDQLALILLATRKRVKKLIRRLQSLENGTGVLGQLGEKLDSLEARLSVIDGEEGRITHLEDELEDVVGQDGDLIDIYERLERLEGNPSAPIRKPQDENPRITELYRRIHEVESKGSVSPDSITAESLQAVKKTGDTMSGGLTIQKGGLHVTSGGIHCRGAEVNSLDASVQVRTPKLVTDQLEVRGDITVDNTTRSLQIRQIEGRSGGGKKDGLLSLNARSGAEVVIGKAEEGEGLRVHGPTRLDGLEGTAASLVQSGFATVFPASDLAPGEVACVDEKGQLVRPAGRGDSRVIGIVASQPAITAGVRPKEGTPTLVVTAGVTLCRVEGPVKPGDRLIASATPGYACSSQDPSPGTVLGKALAASSGATGEVLIVVR